MPRCFVISPIGSPDTEVRENADAVLDYIIEPALKALGVEAVRADKLAVRRSTVRTADHFANITKTAPALQVRRIRGHAAFSADSD